MKSWRASLRVLCLVLPLATGCCRPDQDLCYQQQYTHLPLKGEERDPSSEPYFVAFCVEALHLDYASPQRLFQTVAKHPENGRKEGQVGHAWVVLKGEGLFEGGLSGELGEFKPRYMEGLLQLVEEGDPNPIRYFLEDLEDGFCQRGNGGHWPSLVAWVPLSQEQYREMERCLLEEFDFSSYQISSHHCCSLVGRLAAILGWELEDSVLISITPTVSLGGKEVSLWTEEHFSQIRVGSVDALEKSLGQIQKEGRAFCGKRWYGATHSADGPSLWTTVTLWPKRWARYRWVTPGP